MKRTPREAILVVFAAFTCCVAAAQESKMQDARELIRDPRFQRGFEVYDPKPGKKVVSGVLQWGDGAGKPVWGLAQWSSKSPLAGAKPERLPSGAVRFSNEAKAIAVGPAGTDDADLVMRVNGRVEYGDRPRQKGEPWPHLLVEQAIEGHPSLASLQALQFEISVRLRHCEKFPMDGYTPNLHAAHFQVFITVQNRNRKSPGFGDFLWFGIPLYDDRRRIPTPFMAPDTGHNKFIYTPHGQTFTSESAHGGQWVAVKSDLLPIMREALQVAWERGFLKDSQELADYCLGGINIGWEVPGIFNVELQVRDLSLKAVQRVGQASRLP